MNTARLPAVVLFGVAAVVSVGILRAGEVELTPPVLTLKESVERAVTNNPRLLSARQELSIAKSQLRQARSLFYPKVNLSLNYVRYRNETLGLTSPDLGPLILEAPLAPSSDQRANPFAENLYMGQVWFRQTLFAGGRLQSTYKLSVANVKRAESAYESLKKDIEHETARTFYALVYWQLRIDLLRHYRAELEKTARAGTRLSMGATDRRAEARRRLFEAEKHLKQTRMDLIQLMGDELFSDVRVSGVLDVDPIGVDLATSLAWAKQSRPELRETALQEEADRLSVDLSLAERYPVLVLGGGYEVRNEKFPLEESDWHSGISMNIPIFDGFSSRARIRESRSKAEQGRLHRVELEDRVERQVRSAFNDFSHWYDELLLRNSELAEAKRMEPAARSSVERLEWLGWWLSSELGVAEARYELCLAESSLERAVGRSLTSP